MIEHVMCNDSVVVPFPGVWTIGWLGRNQGARCNEICRLNSGLAITKSHIDEKVNARAIAL